MKKFNVGIAGLGRAGWNMHCGELDKLQDEFNIVSGCDIAPDRCEEFKKRYPEAAVYENYYDFIKNPDIEIVSIVVPTLLHVEYTRAALEAGKIVYLEKPIALNLDEVSELGRLHRMYPGKIFVRHNRRFEAAFNHISEIIASGKLGEVFEVRLCRHRFQMRNDWQTMPECGGGQLNNWGPHLIDHALRFLNSQVDNVYANLQRINCEGNAEDHVKFVLTGSNGRIVDVEISDGASLYGDVYFIMGTRGTLRCTDEKIIEMRTLPDDFKYPEKHPHAESLPRSTGYGSCSNIKWVEEKIEVNPSNGYDMHKAYHYLYQALAEIAPYPVTMEQALDVVRLTQRIKQSTDVILRNQNV